MGDCSVNLAERLGLICWGHYRLRMAFGYIFRSVAVWWNTCAEVRPAGDIFAEEGWCGSGGEDPRGRRYARSHWPHAATGVTAATWRVFGRLSRHVTATATATVFFSPTSPRHSTVQRLLVPRLCIVCRLSLICSARDPVP